MTDLDKNLTIALSLKKVVIASLSLLLALSLISLYTKSDAKYHTKLHLENNAVISDITKYSDYWEYTVKSHGLASEFKTEFIDSIGKFQIGDSIRIAKK
jgi:hypothetical protein